MPTTVDDKPDAQGVEFELDTFLTQFAEQTTKAHADLTASLGDSIGESVAAGIKVALEGLPTPQDQGPQRVRAARFTVVREAPVYSLNQAHPGPSLVRDAYYAATTHDHEALERLRKYRTQTEEVAQIAQVKLASQMLSASFATSTTVTDPEVIPPGYRPDLYVPQLAQERPLVSSASHGTISNATPFVVPVFTSITGGSADHVEGTNPTDGTLAFASKTVSPLGISGLLKLTREIVDSSNPAIDAIALQAMRESYSQQTEGKVYTLLNGTSGAGGVITGDFVPSGAQAVTVAGGTDQQTLVKMLRERLAKYPFNRFASPTRGHLGQGATVRLATAVDTTQRPLFPSMGATNTAGVGNSMTQGWNIDGLGFVPTWAMTGVAAGDSQILFLNSSDLWVWESPLLSFRYEERSGPALIELAMFGYFGTHLLRPVGLSGIRIT
jgi:Phage capsid family